LSTSARHAKIARFVCSGVAMVRLAIYALLAVVMALPGVAADNSKCNAKLFVLWGDGKHDDTTALNAWFRGGLAVWGESGRSVGSQIAGHVFRLSAPVYISSGTGRTIEHFRFVWPARGELVSGGTITSGQDPDQPPVATGLTKIGAGPNEGVPYPSKTPKPAAPDTTGCLVS
jgi:hypothetical protein